MSPCQGGCCGFKSRLPLHRKIMKPNFLFEEGYKAYFLGLSIKNNPYEEFSEAYNQWKKGFKIGEAEDIDQDPDGN